MIIFLKQSKKKFIYFFLIILLVLILINKEIILKEFNMNIDKKLLLYKLYFFVYHQYGKKFFKEGFLKFNKFEKEISEEIDLGKDMIQKN